MRNVLVLTLLTMIALSARGDVFGLHTPTHPRAGASTTLTARGPRTATVEIWYEIFKLAVVNNQLQQTSVAALTRVKTCAPPQPSSGCQHTIANGFSDNSLVRYRAVAINTDGTRETDEYSFAAGDFPLPRRPIPIRVTGRPAGRFDLVMIGDTDLTTPLRGQLGSVLARHFDHGTIYANRRLYNFYYSAFTGNFEPSCQFTKPANYDELLTVANAVVYLHRKTQRDCAKGKGMSCEITGGRTLLHEYGHMLFGLADEYAPDSRASERDCYTNVWRTKARCEADPISQGGTCVRVQKIGGYFWKVDPNDVMAGGQTFGRVCLRRVNWHYTSCKQQQDCFPDCP